MVIEIRMVVTSDNRVILVWYRRCWHTGLDLGCDYTVPVQDVSPKLWHFAVCVFHFSNNMYTIIRRIQFLLKFSQLTGRIFI